jgi:hypothetical protein
LFGKIQGDTIAKRKRAITTDITGMAGEFR